MFKKIISFLICLTMVLSFVPAMAEDVAETTTTEATYVNVALNKPVTSGRYDGYQKREYLVDGDDATGVAYDGSIQNHTGTDNPDGNYSDHSNNWWQIDLGAKYKIDNIVLKYTEENWATKYSLKISVSNSSDFTDGTAVQLYAVDDEGASASPVTIQGNDNSYQYVRLEKTQGLYSSVGYGKYTELEVWVDESTIVKPVNVALNKPITAGNYEKHNAKKEWLIDGDYSTKVFYTVNDNTMTDNADGAIDPHGWFQIDLGARYQIDNIALYKTGGAWDTTYCFNILASNSADFSDGKAVTLAAYPDAAPFVAIEETEDVNDAKLVINGDGNFYRYVRLQKTNYTFNAYTELEVYAFEDTAVYAPNIAVNKPITAGTYDAYGPKTNLNDGNPATAVWYDSHAQTKTDNTDGIPSGKNNAWFQIDLGARYQIENVTMLFGSGYTGCDFKISVSNSPDFSDGTAKVIAAEGETKLVPSPYTATGDGGYYRYVRWERVSASISDQHGHTNFYELEVYAYEDSAIKPVNIAVNKDITAGIYQNAGAANPKANLNDGNMDTVVFCGGTESDNVGGEPSARTDAWFQIDLGARYLIEKIQLWYNASSADYVIPYNFNILVSNSPDFSDGKAVKVIEVGDNGVTPAQVTDGDVTRKLISVASDGNYYRYVRWERTEGSYSIHGYSDLAELEVYAYPENVQNEVITIGTPRHLSMLNKVQVYYAVEGLIEPKTITAYVAVKDKDGKLLSVNLKDIELTQDTDGETNVAVDVDTSNLNSDNICVYVWYGFEPLATLDAISLN